MFIPNLTGSIKSVGTRDIHSRITFGEARECPFAIVNLKASSVKTTVRADSSASRGSADETVVERSVILMPIFVEVGLNDVFTYLDVDYEVVGIHPRHGVCGTHDHNECELQFYLG